MNLCICAKQKRMLSEMILFFLLLLTASGPCGWNSSNGVGRVQNCWYSNVTFTTFKSGSLVYYALERLPGVTDTTFKCILLEPAPNNLPDEGLAPTHCHLFNLGLQVRQCARFFLLFLPQVHIAKGE